MLISNIAIADVTMSTNFVTLESFFWYLEVSAVVTPLTLTPTTETAPKGMLTGKPIKVLRVVTLDIPVAMLRPLEQAFSHTNRLNILEYLEYFLAYLSSSFNNPCAYFGLHLGDRTEVPKKLRVPLGDLGTHYNSSSFLESYDKMADIDIDPFEEHNKTDLHPDETGENVPLTPGGAMGGSTWELGREQETSLGGTSLRMEVLREHVEALY